MPKGSTKIETEILKKAYDFLIDLDKEERETGFAMVQLLQDQPYDPGLVKLVDRETRIYEVRGSTKDFWIRLFWYYHRIPHENRSKIVITNGCIKKQNKTDPNDLKVARKIKSAYEDFKADEYKKLKGNKK